MFGSRSLCWIAQNVFGIKNILHLIDDVLTVDPPEFPETNTMKTLTAMFQRLGITLAVHKFVGPSQCLEY